MINVNVNYISIKKPFSLKFKKKTTFEDNQNIYSKKNTFLERKICPSLSICPYFELCSIVGSDL